MNDISKTIGWAEKSWNPISGCLGPNNDGVTCPYCYARKIAERFRGSKAFPQGFQPTWHPERLDEPLHVKKASRIFAGSVTDFFGDWVSRSQFHQIMYTMWLAEHHTFYVLTKQPQNIGRQLADHHWGYPPNLWLGVSVTCAADLPRLDLLRAAWPRHKFVSFEPLLGVIDLTFPTLAGIEWVILGSQTNPDKPTPPSSTASILYAARECSVPIFIKQNLKPNPWSDDNRKGPQEWPHD
jgi:protein gp37